MISKRQLAAVIWIAIVTIAVQLVPATALAHAGHTHLRGSIVGVAHDRAEGAALGVNADHTGALAQAEAADVSRARTSGAKNPPRSLANELFRGDSAQDDLQPPLSQSDLVPWHSRAFSWSAR